MNECPYSETTQLEGAYRSTLIFFRLN